MSEIQATFKNFQLKTTIEIAVQYFLIVIIPFNPVFKFKLNLNNNQTLKINIQKLGNNLENLQEIN